MRWEELGGKLDDEMRAAFAVTRAALPAMIEQGWGRVTYLGTGVSHQHREGMIALGTAKAALAQFARYLAQELGPRDTTQSLRQIASWFAEDAHCLLPTARPRRAAWPPSQGDRVAPHVS